MSEEDEGGLNDFQRGVLNGWQEALAGVRHCAVDSDAGEFAECLASEGARELIFLEDSLATYDEVLSEAASIELAFFAYGRRD